MADNNPKREIPGPLKSLLKIDVEMSKKCFDQFDRTYGVDKYMQGRDSPNSY
jgi:hypothetical protein